MTTNYIKYNDTRRFNGNKEKILVRDGYKCVNCGMTDKEHIIFFGRHINIDHIDRNNKNNSLSNLQTLCSKCHGKKDGINSITHKKLKRVFGNKLIRLHNDERLAIRNAINLIIRTTNGEDYEDSNIQILKDLLKRSQSNDK